MPAENLASPWPSNSLNLGTPNILNLPTPMVFNEHCYSSETKDVAERRGRDWLDCMEDGMTTIACNTDLNSLRIIIFDKFEVTVERISVCILIEKLRERAYTVYHVPLPKT